MGTVFHLEKCHQRSSGWKSKVPQTMSQVNTSRLPSLFLSSSYAISAVVGSLLTRNTFRPRMGQVSLIAWHCESLKKADTNHHCVVNLGAQIRISSLFRLGEKHPWSGTFLLSHELLLDHLFAIGIRKHFEGPNFHV